MVRRSENPTAHALIQRRYYAQHREERLAASASWREAHPDEVRAYTATYSATHKEEKRLYELGHTSERALRQRHRLLKLPPVVYAWMNPDGKADYVGRGTMIRALQHASFGVRGSTWWTPQHWLLSMTCDSEWHSMELEGKWGGNLLPRFNRDGYRHA